ncbi:MAG: YfiR family protein [Bacteroidota bacterium]
MLFLSTIVTKSQTVVVPVNIHIPILFKAISLEKNINKPDLETFVVGVAYEEGNERSVGIKNEILSFGKNEKYDLLDGKSVRFEAIDVNTTKDIRELLYQINPAALYIAPLNQNMLQKVMSATQKGKVLSITGVPEYVDDGVSVGIGIKGDSPEIIINLAASKEEGAQFSSKVLGLARIVQ